MLWRTLRNLIDSPAIHLLERILPHEIVKDVAEAQLRCANCGRKNEMSYPTQAP
jgi:hypothetical protein